MIIDRAYRSTPPAICLNHWKVEAAKTFPLVIAEQSIGVSSIVLCGFRIAGPEYFHKKVDELAQEGHDGRTRESQGIFT